MAKVTLHLMHVQYMVNMYRAGIGSQLEVAREMLGKGYCYEAYAFDDMDGTVEQVADELFDLTNNPNRQTERERKYGRGRSLSVGDIVQVDDKKLLCCSFGWKHI